MAIAGAVEADRDFSLDGLEIIPITIKPGVDPLERFEDLRVYELGNSIDTKRVQLPPTEMDFELRLVRYVEVASLTSTPNPSPAFMNCGGGAPYGYVSYSPIDGNGISTGLPWAGLVVLHPLSDGDAEVILLYRPYDNNRAQTDHVEKVKALLEA